MRSRNDALSTPVFTPLGDAAITLTFGAEISEALSDRVVSAAVEIRAADLTGVSDIVPSYAALTVHYDPLAIGYLDLRDRIRALSLSSAEARESGSGASHIIPVTYNGEDLEDVARRTGLEVDQVISIHSSTRYRVFVIGFVPGFAYLGPLDSRLVLPRRESPRKRVPRGSVAIAEAQTGIYPADTPGGWHIIGSTDETLFDVSRTQPSLFAVGDIVAFEVVG